MSLYTTTPYMSLQLPIPGQQLGPTYGLEQNTAFTFIDQHNHSPGSGVPISSNGININADLSFNNLYNLINLRTSRYVNQNAALSLATDLNCLYVVNGNLYFNDGSGNQVQLTLAGAVDVSSSGNISGMGATTASVVYTSVNSTFTFNSNTATPAKMKFGPIQLGENVANSNFVTITPSIGLSSSYTMTLPSNLPTVTTKILMWDTSGQVLNGGVDSATIVLTSNVLSVGLSSLDTSYLSASANIVGTQLSSTANILGSQLSASAAIVGTQLSSTANILGSQLSASAGIVNGQITNNTITKQKLAALGQQISNDSGAFSSGSTSFVPVTNLSINITTTGRPVILLLQGTSNTSTTPGFQLDNGSGTAVLAFIRDSTTTVGTAYLAGPATYGGQTTSLMCIDPISAGTYNYKVSVKSNGVGNVLVNTLKLVAYEL